MKVLIVGSGGREHALAWKLAQSPHVELLAAPGNPGIAELGECLPVPVSDSEGLVALAGERAVDLTVVGPEAPLCAGLADRFAAAGLAVFGPSQAAATIEGSKVFAKEFMRQHNIPTAPFEVFDDHSAALAHVRSRALPLVVKADGLAAGKGVAVCSSVGEAEEALEEMMVRRAFGESGRRVLIEDCLSGLEVSIHCLSDGSNLVTLPAAMDHKRVNDDDQGPNTGGMGCFAPALALGPELAERVRAEILEPTIAGLKAEGREYRGLLYPGLMLTREGPRVLEFNCRFGDPETQVLMPLIEGDLLPALLACAGAGGSALSRDMIRQRQGYSVCVVMASQGYPGSYQTGKPITIDAAWPASCLLLHAGTARDDGRLVTAGGRVLGVTSLPQPSLYEAIIMAYRGVASVYFEGTHNRKDIGRKGLAG